MADGKRYHPQYLSLRYIDSSMTLHSWEGQSDLTSRMWQNGGRFGIFVKSGLNNSQEKRPNRWSLSFFEMAEPKRLEFKTITPTQKPKKKLSYPPADRFSLTLTDSTETTCPEFSYTELVKNAVVSSSKLHQNVASYSVFSVLSIGILYCMHVPSILHVS